MLLVLKHFVLKLKTILKFALTQSAVVGLYHKDTISNDVYDSGMVFYNVLFLDDEAFYTAFECVCYLVFLPKVLTLILSLLCRRALERFCTSQNFCNSDLFVATYTKMNKKKM